MTITVVIPTYKRKFLTRVVLGYYRRLADNLCAQDIHLRLLTVGDGRWSEEGLSHVHVLCMNQPLSFKYQHGFNSARVYRDDGVMIIGSDDLCDDRLFFEYQQLWKDNPLFIGLRGQFVFELTTGITKYFPGYPEGERKWSDEPVGSWRFYSTELLDRLEWRLWPEAREWGLDGMATVRMMEHPAWDAVRQDMLVIDSRCGVAMKGPVCMTSAHKFDQFPDVEDIFEEDFSRRLKATLQVCLAHYRREQ